MKKEFRCVKLSLNRTTVVVIPERSPYPAGNSGYCNHIMVVFFELAHL